MGYNITKENAVEYARRAAISRQSKQVARAKRESNPVLACASRETLEELEIVEEQIGHTRDVLNDKTPHCPACERPALEPKDRASLLRALDVLLDRRRKLTGRFNPGTLKQPEKKLSPILVIDEPQPVAQIDTPPQNGLV